MEGCRDANDVLKEDTALLMTESQHPGQTVNELMTHLGITNDDLLMGTNGWILTAFIDSQPAQLDSPSLQPILLFLSWVNKG